MPSKRGRSHTTLTESAALVVFALRRQPGIKMIAPGIIDGRRSGKRHITAVYTNAGMELIISGTGVQKVAVHLERPSAGPDLMLKLTTLKTLSQFTFHNRDRKPKI